jgi:uncharacterized sporulation protein YeaH/YhbH (DUF444 family)
MTAPTPPAAEDARPGVDPIMALLASYTPRELAARIVALQAERDAAVKDAERLHKELESIANVNSRMWGVENHDREFRVWAQNRARAAIAAKAQG